MRIAPVVSDASAVGGCQSAAPETIGPADRLWQSMVPAGKVLASDASLDITVLHPSRLPQAALRLAEEAAERAVAGLPVPAHAREVHSRGHDASLIKMLRDFTELVDGVPPFSPPLVFHSCASDPGTFISHPQAWGGDFKSGGSLTLHQDYKPSPATRCVSYYMLLQDTPQQAGPTFVFPHSRELSEWECVEREARATGRPRKRRGRVEARSDGQINPKNRNRSLKHLCGDPLLLTGARLTVFRHESAEWHGALPNQSNDRRCVLIWSYCTPDFQGCGIIESS